MAQSQLIVGFTYNEKRNISHSDLGAEHESDAEAEFDTPATLNAIREALRDLGHRVVDLEAVRNLPRALSETPVDLVFNIAEGTSGRNREAQVPALLELMGIPYTGSDSTALCLALDKGIAKRVLSTLGVRTAKFQVFTNASEKLRGDLRFPFIVKPVAEGSSKGIFQNGVVHDEKQLKELCARLLKKHKQSILVEEFLSGREFTVGILGSPLKPRVLPPMEIVFEEKAGLFPVYSFLHKLERNDEVRNDPHPVIDVHLRAKIEELAVEAYAGLGCRDVARIDLRLDAEGNPCFIECNPLPGLSPGWSDLCLITDAMQMPYTELIAEILRPATKRMHEQKGNHAIYHRELHAAP